MTLQASNGRCWPFKKRSWKLRRFGDPVWPEFLWKSGSENHFFSSRFTYWIHLLFLFWLVNFYSSGYAKIPLNTHHPDEEISHFFQVLRGLESLMILGFWVCRPSFAKKGRWPTPSWLKCNARDGDIYREGTLFANIHMTHDPYWHWCYSATFQVDIFKRVLTPLFCTLVPAYQRHNTGIYICSQLRENVEPVYAHVLDNVQT